MQPDHLNQQPLCTHRQGSDTALASFMIVMSSVTTTTSETRMTARFKNRIQTHKRLKRTLFIRTKHNMQILGVIPFFKLQNNTYTTVKL